MREDGAQDSRIRRSAPERPRGRTMRRNGCIAMSVHASPTRGDGGAVANIGDASVRRGPGQIATAWPAASSYPPSFTVGNARPGRLHSRVNSPVCGRRSTDSDWSMVPAVIAAGTTSRGLSCPAREVLSPRANALLWRRFECKLQAGDRVSCVSRRS
jgi:hypothetical protein